MQIKSLDDLKKIRDQFQNTVGLRLDSENKGDNIEVLIGMATCGISSGAKETKAAFEDELGKQGISNVKIVKVGCIGYCHSEPTVQINIPGQNPVLYGNVKKDKVNQIIESHIKGGNPVEDLIINVDFKRA